MENIKSWYSFVDKMVDLYAAWELLSIIIMLKFDTEWKYFINVFLAYLSYLLLPLPLFVLVHDPWSQFQFEQRQDYRDTGVTVQRIF